jgi:alpha-1,2-mannosyltransferase
MWWGLVLACWMLAGGVIALQKGGDYSGFERMGRQLLHGQSLYADSGVGMGVTWPPFAAVFFAPFAAAASLAAPAGKLLWIIVSVGSLLLAVPIWAAALRTTAPETASSFSWRDVGLPLLAVALPVQTNFEHLNMNPILLLVLGVAALRLRRHDDRVAGALVGTAAALKAFPALLIVYFLLRRFWHAAISAIAVAVGLTLVPVLGLGWTLYRSDVVTWLTISGTGGWPTREDNQSLFALCVRYFGRGHLPTSDAATAGSDPVALYIWSGAVALILLSICVWAAHGDDETERESAPREMAAMTTAAVILSPIAWDHYWVLLFPALFAAWNDRRTGARNRSGRTIFWIAAALTSGSSPLIVGRTGFAMARALSFSTIAGVLLLVYLMTSTASSRPGRNTSKTAAALG